MYSNDIVGSGTGQLRTRTAYFTEELLGVYSPAQPIRRTLVRVGDPSTP
jgi:hypothetical protein